MNKLNPETAQAIANLITSINVNSAMHRDAADDKKGFWLAEEFKDIIELTEKYGIPHNNYALAVRCMNEDMFANATL